MRTIVIAVAILSACFMQEVSGDAVLSSAPVDSATLKTEPEKSDEDAEEAAEAAAHEAEAERHPEHEDIHQAKEHREEAAASAAEAEAEAAEAAAKEAAEVAAEAQAMMSVFDTDKDGKISYEELVSAETKQTGITPHDREVVLKAFEAGDTDGDKHLSLKEIPAFVPAYLQAFEKEKHGEEL